MAYHRYRGQRSALRSLRNIFIVLLVLAAVVVAAFFYLQRFMVYTDEGAYLDIPFLRSPETPPPAKPPEVTLEVVSPTPAPTPESTAVPVLPGLSVMHAAFISAGDAADPSKADGYIKLCEETGINALVIEMKSENGLLGYKSSSETAIAAGASGPDTRAFVSKLKSDGIYLAAYISCFKDDLVPRKLPAMAVKVQSGVMWLDARNQRWLNPHSEDARQYIIDICEELCDLGFDEIVLDNAVFPTVGRPELISYAENASVPKTSCINGFIAELSETLLARGTALSAVILQKTAAEGFYADAGQDFAELADMLHRIFIPINSAKAGDEFNAAYESAMLVFGNRDEAEKRLIPIITVVRAGVVSPADSLSVTLGLAGGDRGFGYLVKSDKNGYEDIKAALG